MITCSDSDHNHGGDNMHDLWSSWSWWYRPCQGLWLRTTLEFPPLSQNHENHLHDHLQHYHTNAGVEEDSPSKPDGRGEVQGLLLLHLLGLHVVSLKKMSECIFPMSFVYLLYLICLYLSYLLPAERREPVQEIEADCNDLQFNTLSKQIENNNLNYPKIIIVIMLIKTLSTLTDTSTRIQRVYLNGWRKETSWEARGCCKWSRLFSW